MVIGVDNRVITRLSSQDIDRPVGYDFINVHIHRSPRSTLDRVDDKLVLPLTVNNFITCLDHGLG